MGSIMNGNYPGPGITLGPALTFGYIAGRHLAQINKDFRPAKRTSMTNAAAGFGVNTYSYILTAVPPIPSRGSRTRDMAGSS